MLLLYLFLKSCQWTVRAENPQTRLTDLGYRLAARQLHTSFKVLVKDVEHQLHSLLAIVLFITPCQYLKYVL